MHPSVCYVIELGNFGQLFHYGDVKMDEIASQITSLTVVYSIVYSYADQRKHQSSASLAIVRGIHRDQWIPRTKSSNAENGPFWWRHHAIRAVQQQVGSLSVCVSDLFIDGSLQDCSISSALTMEILQPCSEPSISSCRTYRAAIHGKSKEIYSDVTWASMRLKSPATRLFVQ